MILVTGATGPIGGEVVRQLVEAKHKVRALVRDPAKAEKFGSNVEIVKGDFEDPASLRAALKDVEVAFLATAPTERMLEQETNLINAAKAARLARLVKLANFMAAPKSPAPLGRLHGQIELRLAASGIAATVLRPGWYMSNFFGDAASVKTGQLYGNAGDGRICFTDPVDIAAVAVAALLDPVHAGHFYKITGPEALTYEEAAATFTRVLGYKVTSVGTDDANLGTALRAAMVSEFIIDEMVEIFAMVRRGELEFSTNAVQQVLGRPARSLEQWVTANRSAFSK